APAWPIWLFTSAWNWGSWLRVCSISGPARFWKAAELTVTIGLGDVKSRFGMREPVITTSSVGLAAGASAAAADPTPAAKLKVNAVVQARADLEIRPEIKRCIYPTSP